MSEQLRAAEVVSPGALFYVSSVTARHTPSSASPRVKISTFVARLASLQKAMDCRALPSHSYNSFKQESSANRIGVDR